MSELQDGGELLDDPAPLLVAGRVFVITRLKYSLSRSGRTVHRVRELSADNLTELAQSDLDLSDAADGRGRVSGNAEIRVYEISPPRATLTVNR